MLKKIFTVYLRDLKVNMRDVLSLTLVIFPLVFAVGINLITPGINDTTVNLAMVESEDNAQAEYYDDFAHVLLFDDLQGVEDRIMQRDDVFGIVREDGGFVVLAQGNESEMTVDYVRLLKTLYESGATLEDSKTKIVEFGRTIPPLKQMLVNSLLLLNAVLAGMMISLNIVEEKADKTVAAINVTPVSRFAFLLGKSLFAIISVIILSIACIFITGFSYVNIWQVLLVVLATSALSMIIGFLQGLSSTDVMEAAGSVKLMFLPLAGSIVGYELLAVKWHIFLYWSPFYWAYKANDMILSQGGSAKDMLICIAAILLICGVIFALLAPKIRKSLE
ncbi:MAG: ABC transporter permease [Clostridia bacterium]|nr:ABC transporter permease [Clostridia bacterium]